MALSRQLRLLQELDEMRKDPPSMASAGPVNRNMSEWQGTLIGPSNSPYDGGKFKLSIQFPESYPLSPPMIRFTTPIYHLNINDNGNICLDLLRNKWKPTLTLKQLLFTILALLSHPNPDDPYDGVKAQVYKADLAEYKRNASRKTRDHAR